ncbi:hypothetical protein GW813_03930 [bacterium]|nr:hypothetical protein [bacterium]PIV81096.1 MAG: hypothetical protein COW53_06180 [bacterium CG17_big_fil_post_rev_8_21_14_2_50_64_8]PJA75659.1 MAG: hypothetical protein CO151_05585 [bacterium CG_4_9_14_3_um_filter_65_15]
MSEMNRSSRSRRRPWLLAAVVAAGLLLVGCGGTKIEFHYPDEQIDFSQGVWRTPTLYIDKVTDMRSPEQREGSGHFFTITYPKQDAWAQPVTEVYGLALAQDLDQTQLVDLVAFPGQAEFVLSVDLLSLGATLKRTPASFLVPGLMGAGLGAALGEDASGRIGRALVLGFLATAAIPMPTQHHAEAEVRMTLRDAAGDIVWQETCFGEYEGKKAMSATAREDQELVDRFLSRAVKRANGCLLGQLRQALQIYEIQHPPADGS